MVVACVVVVGVGVDVVGASVPDGRITTYENRKLKKFLLINKMMSVLTEFQSYFVLCVLINATT